MKGQRLSPRHKARFTRWPTRPSAAPYLSCIDHVAAGAWLTCVPRRDHDVGLSDMRPSLVLISAGMAFASSAVGQTPTVYCARYRGTDASRKLAACFAALPATGGVADATGIIGVQSLSFDPFQGVS